MSLDPFVDRASLGKLIVGRNTSHDPDGESVDRRVFFASIHQLANQRNRLRSALLTGKKRLTVNPMRSVNLDVHRSRPTAGRQEVVDAPNPWALPAAHHPAHGCDRASLE